MAKPTFADLQELIARTVLPFYYIDRDISTSPPTKALSLIFLHLDEFRYDREKKVTLEHFVQHMQPHRQKARIHDGAFEYYDAVWSALLVHPERFHKQKNLGIGPLLRYLFRP
jgi:hypothetical protein